MPTLFGRTVKVRNPFKTRITNQNIHDLVNKYVSGRKNELPLDLRFKPIGEWDVHRVTRMTNLFNHAQHGFNEPLNNWDVSNVTDMQNMFQYAESFNSPLNRWNVSNVTNMGGMFERALTFNQPLDMWNVSNVTNMEGMFRNASEFNKPLNGWNVSNVRNMRQMFYGARMFNQPLNDWNVSNVEDMDYIFDFPCSFGITDNVKHSINNWNPIRLINTGRVNERIFQDNYNFRNWRPQWFINGLAESENMMRRHMQQQTQQRNQNQNREANLVTETGRANQVHYAAANTKLDEIINIIKPIVNKPNSFYNNMTGAGLVEYIKNKFIEFINSESQEIDFNIRNYLRALKAIFNKISYIETDKSKYGNLVDYIFEQPDYVKNFYTKIFVDECVHGYGEGTQITFFTNVTSNLSCVGGLKERLYLSLKNPLLFYCITNPENCTQIYKDILLRGFNINIDNYKELDKNTLTQKWNEEHLSNEEYLREQGIVRNSNGTFDEKEQNLLRNDYVKFMYDQYKKEGLLTNDIKNMIQEEWINLEEGLNIFQRGEFGGKRRPSSRTTKGRRKNGRKTNKKINKRKTSKNRK